MKSNRLSNCTPDTSFQLALRSFEKRIPLEMSKMSEVEYDKQNMRFHVSFLGDEYFISHPEAEFHINSNREGEIESYMKVLLLHYLLQNERVTETGNRIPFRNLPSGIAYEGAFLNRAIKPIEKTFSSDIGRFKESCKCLGGIEVDQGECAFLIPVLPLISLLYMLWMSDNELPGSANILFDSSVSKLLPTEDLAVLGELTTLKLISTPIQI